MPNNPQWTDHEHRRLEELRLNGLTAIEIANDPMFKGKRTDKAIQQRAFEKGYTKIRGKKMQVLELLSTMTRSQIARKLECPIRTIDSTIRNLRKSGFPIPMKRRIWYKRLPEYHQQYQTMEELLISLGVSYNSYMSAICRYRKKIGPIQCLPRTKPRKETIQSYRRRFVKHGECPPITASMEIKPGFVRNADKKSSVYPYAYQKGVGTTKQQPVNQKQRKGIDNLFIPTRPLSSGDFRNAKFPKLSFL